MATFNVRVELINKKDEATYNELHKAMYNANYFRAVEGDDGLWYDLPTATYFKDAALDIVPLYAEVAVIVRSVLKNPLAGRESFLAITHRYDVARFELVLTTDSNRVPAGVQMPQKKAH